jgi:toxin-antitoxin system PIN domain toxin
VIVPDTNLLIYAHDELSPYFKKAHAWWKAALSESHPIGIPWVVVLAFTRLMTHPQICENPLSIEEVRQITEGWFVYPHVRLIGVGQNSLKRFNDLLEEAGMGGNLSTDALIALHCLEYSATIYSNDRDFDRFGGVRRVNPLG